MRVPASSQTPLSARPQRSAEPAVGYRTVFVRNPGVLSDLARSVAAHREQMTVDAELVRRLGG